MEWVQGEPLNVYVENNLQNTAALVSLAEKWLRMVQDLGQAKVAHGDLQHGNIFVVSGELRLIDYDGMFVPGLSGQRSHELGHPNYQHPLRTAHHFGTYLDNFSAWVIYLSIISLTLEPRLWRQTRKGDECLLFCKEDFQRPELSPVFIALEASRDQRVRSMASLLKSFLLAHPDTVPPLDVRSEHSSKSAFVGRGAWIDDHLRPDEHHARTLEKGARKGPYEVESGIFPEPSWILDSVTTAGHTVVAARFQNSFRLERLVGLLSVLGIIAATIMMSVTPQLRLARTLCIFLLFGLNALLWYLRYHHDPASRRRTELAGALACIIAERESAEKSLRAFEEERKCIRDRATTEHNRLADQEAALQVSHQISIDKTDEDLKRTLASMRSELMALDRDETHKLAQLREDIERKATAITRSLDGLRLEEQQESSSIVLARQRRHREEFLRRHSIYDHAIPGISAYFLSKLWDAGYRSAYDLTKYQSGAVRGIGPIRAAAIAEWVRDVTRLAQTGQPHSLSLEEKAALQRKYGTRRTSLEMDLAQERWRIRALEDPNNTVRVSYKKLRDTKERESSAATVRAEKEKEALLVKFNAQRQGLSQAFAILAEATDARERAAKRQIKNIRDELLRAAWREEKARREATAWDDIRFHLYVRRILVNR
jgi:hypothetical protein